MCSSLACVQSGDTLYSTSQTALPAGRKLPGAVYAPHSEYSKHCSLSAQSKAARKLAYWLESRSVITFFRPMDRGNEWASFPIARSYATLSPSVTFEMLVHASRLSG